MPRRDPLPPSRTPSAGSRWPLHRWGDLQDRGRDAGGRSPMNTAAPDGIDDSAYRVSMTYFSVLSSPPETTTVSMTGYSSQLSGSPPERRRTCRPGLRESIRSGVTPARAESIVTWALSGVERMLRDPRILRDSPPVIPCIPGWVRLAEVSLSWAAANCADAPIIQSASTEIFTGFPHVTDHRVLVGRHEQSSVGCRRRGLDPSVDVLAPDLASIPTEQADDMLLERPT